MDTEKEIAILDEMNKSIKGKIRKVRKINRKYKITSIHKTPIIKKNLKKKNPTKDPVYWKYEERTKFFRRNKISKDNCKNSIDKLRETINVKETLTV